MGPKLGVAEGCAAEAFCHVSDSNFKSDTHPERRLRLRHAQQEPMVALVIMTAKRKDSSMWAAQSC